ncbi:MAG: hypothetical protein EOP33_08880, partial [Rickettsiaceae bacterium]
MLDSIPGIIPTDNLYKFMSLTGMILFFFCLFYPSWRVYSIEKSAVEIRGKGKLLDQRIKIIEQSIMEGAEDSKELEEISLRNDQKDAERKNRGMEVKQMDDFTYEELASYFKNKEFRDAFEFVLDHKDQLYINYRIRVTENEKREKDVNILHLSSIELNNLNDLALFEKQRADYIIVLGLIGCIVSFIVSAVGFTLWYKNYQSVVINFK